MIAVAIMTCAAAVLHAMGRVPICECGTIRLWHGNIMNSENSQHLSDWYSFSHIIHGFGFYALAHFAALAIRRPIPIKAAFLVALALESGWEILENTDFIIDRYREATVSLDYYGDSIVNSLSDMFAMAFGFFLAHRFQPSLVILAAVAMEGFTFVMIGDNLTLNIVMLVWPLEALKEWQATFQAQ